jgi:N-methylhydantoinase B
MTTANVADAVTAEVVRNALAVAAEEASIVVVRSSHSTFIQEGADACSAILDAKGQLVSQSTATSLMHGASLRCSLPALLEDHPLDTMVEGDVFAMNDPYRGGIHANDIVVFRPVFADGRPRWFAGTLIHVADVGGSAVGGLAALAQDCFSEGLLLPPIHLYAAGEARTEVFAILRRNSRAPEKVVGDVQALVAGVNTMARRLDELIERYGADELERVVDEHLDATEARTRAGLRELGDGTYTGSYQIDSDGLTDREYFVNVTVTLEDGTLTADFTGTSPQSGGAINASYSQTLSGVVFAMRCLVDPTLPMNEGCFRPLVPNFPLGTLVNPMSPAACGGRIVTVAGATDAMLRALSEARPDKATAASGLIHVWTLSGAGWLSLFYEFGGIGGRAGSDGPDATGCFFLGGRSVIPQIEPMEAQYPFVVRHSKLLADSGGKGQWRGGLGMETEIELLDDAMITVRGARMEIPPPGTNGGEPGVPGSWFIRRLDGREEELAVRQADVPITRGERFIVRTSGGGGLGRPEDRDPALVAADVRDGKVS